MEGSLGEERNESGKSKDRVHLPEWNAMKMQSNQPSQVTEFKYLGSTLQSDGDTTTEVNKRTRCGWKMSGVLCDKRVPPHA